VKTSLSEFVEEYGVTKLEAMVIWGAIEHCGLPETRPKFKSTMDDYMGMFADGVNRRILRDKIQVRDEAHYEELYKHYRDEIFIDKYGMTFRQWMDGKQNQKGKIKKRG
jgi:hypothetical protein